MNIIFIKLYILNLGYIFSSINKAKFDTSIINSNFSNFKGDFYESNYPNIIQYGIHMELKI